MAKTSKEEIIRKAALLFAEVGMEQFSIRKLAKDIPITPSVIYHYFENESQLLKTVFDSTNTLLGIKRANLPKPENAEEMLMQRIAFQIDNQTEIVTVLKYYLANRREFPKFKNGFVPDKSSLHIEEVLQFGIKTGEFHVQNLEDDAKVITHAINGFLLEYLPYTPTGIEKKELIQRIYSFLIRALTNKNE